MPYLSFSQLHKKKQQQQQQRPAFDFIIVGAGSSGCPLASRLSEDLSVTVLLIEAGAKQHGIQETVQKNIPITAGKLHHTSLDWVYYAEPQYPRACTRLNTFEGALIERKYRSFWPRGKCVGGCSAINYMMYCRGHPNDYNDWETRFGARGWNWDAVQPIYQRLENTSECFPQITCPKCRGTTGPLGISHKTPPCSLATAFLAAAKTLGYTPGDYNCSCKTYSKGVVGIHQQTVRQGTRCDVARAYIDPLLFTTKKSLQRPNLFVLTGTKCVKIITESGAVSDSDGIKACGVQVVQEEKDGTNNNNASPIEIRCNKEVILSAGALGSPQILLQSGIGPKGTLVDLPHVGRNLQDHLYAPLRYTPKLGQGKQNIDSINSAKAEGITSIVPNLLTMLLFNAGVLTSSTYDASLFFHSSSKNVKDVRYPDCQLSIFCSIGDKDMQHNSIGIDMTGTPVDEREYSPSAEGLHLCCTILHPKSKGYVELDNTKNKNNGLKIHANYLNEPEDMKCMIQVLRTGFRLANAGPFQDLITDAPSLPQDLCEKHKIAMPIHPSGDDIPDAFWEDYIRRCATTLYHPVGTCRIGKDATEGVVDAKLCVFGVEKLRVVDASIQPEIVSGNTNASCIMIGERAADILQQDYDLKSNPDYLSEAVIAYEARIRLKRYKWVLMALMMFSLLSAAVITVAVWKYHRKAFFEEYWDDEGMCAAENLPFLGP